MAAGQGFKTFVTGEVLTSGDVNGYLMQGINVFTNATARDAAITAPAEGQFAFTKDNNSLWYYDGAAWVASGATGDIEGVTAGVGISGGGTSGTVTITNSMATAIDAKGDLVPGTGADTFARLAVGANNTVLTADSAEVTGLKWATPSSGGYTLISTASLSGSSTVVSSIPGTYQDLRIVLTNFRTTNDGDNIFFRFNADATANRHNQSYNEFAPTGAFDGDHATLTGDQDNTASGGLLVMDIPSYTASTWKMANSLSLYPQYTTPTNWKSWQTQPFYNQTTAISSLEFYPRFGTWAAGTISVYGVK